jgi:hypothetical protein
MGLANAGDVHMQNQTFTPVKFAALMLAVAAAALVQGGLLYGMFKDSDTVAQRASQLRVAQARQGAARSVTLPAVTITARREPAAQPDGGAPAAVPVAQAELARVPLAQ